MKQALHFFTFILDILFPKSDTVYYLEQISSQGLYAVARKNIETRDIESIFSYKDPLIQAGLWEVKYRKNIKIAKIFAQLLQEAILADVDVLPVNSVIIPIPLSKKRLQERGYNQCSLLVENISLPYEKNFRSLQRIRHTPPQTSLKREQRLNNLKKSFAVAHPELITGKTIILIDDVSTTGATLNQAEKTLLKAGAREVKMYTVAR